MGKKDSPNSQNTIADLTEKLNPAEIQVFIYEDFKRAWHGKRFTPFALKSGIYAAAVDGVETHHSRENNCKDCLSRVHKRGTEKQWIEYYHREVVFSLVGKCGAFFIASEPVSPRYNDSGKDSEVAAAKRLLSRLAKAKILKYFTIVVLDALYAKAPFIELIEFYRLIPVIRIKQENYNIIKDIKGLDKEIPFSEARLDKERLLKYQIREFTDLTSWDSYPGKLRIVEIKGEYIKKKINNNYHAHWVLPQNISVPISMELIRITGHWRWKEELNIFRSLKQNFKVQHVTHHHHISIQVVFLLKCFIHSLLNLYLIRKLNPFTKQQYFLRDLIEIIKTNIFLVEYSYVKKIRAP